MLDTAGSLNTEILAGHLRGQDAEYQVLNLMPALTSKP